MPTYMRVCALWFCVCVCVCVCPFLCGRGSIIAHMCDHSYHVRVSVVVYMRTHIHASHSMYVSHLGQVYIFNIE